MIGAKGSGFSAVVPVEGWDQRSVGWATAASPLPMRASSQRLQPAFCRVGKGALPLRGEKTLRAFAHPTEIPPDHENVIRLATLWIDYILHT